MSAAKRGGGADEIYATHLFGNPNLMSNTPAVREAAIERMYVRVLTELAANRFQWSGLPDSVDPRFLEMTLFYTALCVYYFDEDYDKELAVRGSGVSYVNMLDNPTSFTVIGPGSVIKGSDEQSQFRNKMIGAYDPTRHADLDDAEKRRKAIPIWANYVRFPDLDIVRVYAKRFAEIDRTIEINSKNARRNKVVTVSDNMKLSAVNITRQLDEGVDGLQISGGALSDLSFIQALDLGIDPKSFSELHLLRTRWWNECMGLLGIDNANQDKKERLVAAEVSANDAQTDSMRYVAINARQQAAEQINAVFGRSITVDYRAEIEAQAAAKAAELGINTESEDDE